jgi:hypothetical protein
VIQQVAGRENEHRCLSKRVVVEVWDFGDLGQGPRKQDFSLHWCFEWRGDFTVGYLNRFYSQGGQVGARLKP